MLSGTGGGGGMPIGILPGATMFSGTGGGGGMPIGICAGIPDPGVLKFVDCAVAGMDADEKPRRRFSAFLASIAVTREGVAPVSASTSSAENRFSLDPIMGTFGEGPERDIDVIVEESPFAIPVVSGQSPLELDICICIGVCIICVIELLLLLLLFAEVFIAPIVMLIKFMESELSILFAY